MIAGANRTIDWADREKAKLDNGERTLEKINEKSSVQNQNKLAQHRCTMLDTYFQSLRVEPLDGSKAQISGYASIFNKASVLGGGFVEKIQKEHLERPLQERGTKHREMISKLFFNHSTDLVLGSKRAGTLRLQKTQKDFIMKLIWILISHIIDQLSK
ncbi:MAG: hypothetical protein CM15mV130_270 [Caudoviricetes sp.]|nr:MAG: hypothetical protein CM15mV130_270 [Caudoviricetes sp.]